MPLKFAYLGLWHSHAVMHVRDAASRPDEFQLVGVYEPDPTIREAKLGEWAGDLPDIPVFDSIEEALDSDAEAIICEGRVSENLDYAERALEAGKHVLLEKPAGVDMAQLQRLHGTARRKGLASPDGLHVALQSGDRGNDPAAQGWRAGRSLLFPGTHPEAHGVPCPAGRRTRLVQRVPLFRNGRPPGGCHGHAHGQTAAV